MPSFLTRDDYKVELEIFEGPLNLLLYLIRRDEVDIYERALPGEEIVQQHPNGLQGYGICDEFQPVIVTAAVTDAVEGEPYEYDVNAAGLQVEERQGGTEGALLGR